MLQNKSCLDVRDVSDCSDTRIFSLVPVIAEGRLAAESSFAMVKHAVSLGYTHEPCMDSAFAHCPAGVDVPEDCWMRVGEEKRQWQNGKALVLDTSFQHETGNNSKQDRIVLIIDFWHPGAILPSVLASCATNFASSEYCTTCMSHMNMKPHHA